MGTIIDWAQAAVSWVLVWFIDLYADVFGLTSGRTWSLAFISLALLVTVLLAYPTRRQLQMQRLSWEITPVTLRITRAYKRDPATGNAIRRGVNKRYGFNVWWQLGPTMLSLAVFLTLNSVVEGLSYGSAEGVFAWPENKAYMDAATSASFLGVPFPTGLRNVSESPNPWWAAGVILAMLALMIPINAALQRQINGPLASNKWMRGQQRISLYSQPVTLLLLVVAFNIGVGVMLFQLACDVFSLGIQSYWLRRRPLPPIDTEWLAGVLADLPDTKPPA